MGQPKAWLQCNGSPGTLQLAKLLRTCWVRIRWSLVESPPFRVNLPVAQRQELERYAVISDRVRGLVHGGSFGALGSRTQDIMAVLVGYPVEYRSIIVVAVSEDPCVLQP